VLAYLSVSLPIVYVHEQVQRPGTRSVVTRPRGTPERTRTSGRSRNGCPCGTRSSAVAVTGCNIPSCSARYSMKNYGTELARGAWPGRTRQLAEEAQVPHDVVKAGNARYIGC